MSPVRDEIQGLLHQRFLQNSAEFSTSKYTGCFKLTVLHTGEFKFLKPIWVIIVPIIFIIKLITSRLK